jgi:hypothetical protein
MVTFNRIPEARVAELVDALDSKSSSFGSAGSIPALGTVTKPLVFQGVLFFLSLSFFPF